MTGKRANEVISHSVRVMYVLCTRSSVDQLWFNCLKLLRDALLPKNIRRDIPCAVLWAECITPNKSVVQTSAYSEVIWCDSSDSGDSAGLRVGPLQSKLIEMIIERSRRIPVATFQEVVKELTILIKTWQKLRKGQVIESYNRSDPKLLKVYLLYTIYYSI